MKFCNKVENGAWRKEDTEFQSSRGTKGLLSRDGALPLHAGKEALPP